MIRTRITRSNPPLTRTKSHFPWIWLSFSVTFTRITRIDKCKERLNKMVVMSWYLYSQCGHSNRDFFPSLPNPPPFLPFRRLLRRLGNWRKESQRFLKIKDCQVVVVVFFFKFESCFLRGRVSSNGFKVFNGCIVEPWILFYCFWENVVIDHFRNIKIHTWLRDLAE